MDSPERKSYKQAWERKNRTKINARRKERRDEQRDRHLAWRRAWYAKNGNRIRSQQRAARLHVRFGIQQADYDAMLEKQDGRCACCLRAFERTPCVDHDHMSGMVRGLLCNGCNVAIGMMDDDPERLKAAAAYLQRSFGENGTTQLVRRPEPTGRHSAVPHLAS